MDEEVLQYATGVHILSGKFVELLLPGILMADQIGRKGGGKLTRSQTVTIRLDPRLHYLANLAARRQRRTLSSYVEWAIEGSLDSVYLRDGNQQSVTFEAEFLWDVDDADRFARLALHYPELLTHDEQVLWKVIVETDYLWRWIKNGIDVYCDHAEKNLWFPRLREQWENLNAVARGDADRSILPTLDRDEALTKIQADEIERNYKKRTER